MRNWQWSHQQTAVEFRAWRQLGLGLTAQLEQDGFSRHRRRETIETTGSVFVRAGTTGDDSACLGLRHVFGSGERLGR